MDSGQALRMTKACWLLAMLLIASWAVAASAADKINFVILLCDDLGYGDLGCYGNEEIHSPHIDQLAAEGVRLTDCYSAAPVCSPSRAGLLTGRIPQRLGIRQWIAPGSGIFLRPGETTIAQLLQQAGYRTCHAGKWHLNSRTDGSERTPGEAGFDHWLYTQNNARPGHRGPENFVRSGEPVGKITGLSSHIVVDEAITFLEAHPGEPFFLNLWFHETHEPVVAAPRLLDMYADEPNVDRRHYLADVTQMDAAVGKLMAYLDEHGLRDNTLVFFSSDNGPETLNIYPSAKRCYGSAGPLRGRKLQVTEGGYRVPGILRWPGRVAAGTVLSEPVCSVASTCCRRFARSRAWRCRTASRSTALTSARCWPEESLTARIRCTGSTTSPSTTRGTSRSATARGN
jgi:arylsulfatase A